MDKQLNYDELCRYVGHLYLTSQQEIDRAQTILGGQIQVLRSELDKANEQIEFLRKNK